MDAERKQVTVLFADVMGSMDLAEQHDPEEWHAIMRRFFSLLAAAVESFEGTVDKFTGDGIMAVFGAPVAHEDHARRACYAALRMLDDVADYAAELRRAEGLNFSVRIGVNSGEVVAGEIGGGESAYTAVGHTVGLAQRMEALAEPGKAYVTQSTAELARGFLALADLGEFAIKGASEPVGVFELAGVGEARSRLDLSRERGFSRFVGRAAEMGSLEAALRRAQAGDGLAVGIAAEPGVGKSRLCHEFVERCRAEEVEVFEAQAQAHGRSIPFLPVLQMLRAFFGIGEGEPEQLAREKIAGRALLLDPGFAGPAADVRLPRGPRSRASGPPAESRGAPAGARRDRLPPRQRPEAAQDAGPADRGPALDGRGLRSDARRADRLDRGDEHAGGPELPARVRAPLGRLRRLP
ncbi:MAG TPA: adenylate/guanylate cyclase domain-containing protein, partial [Solirubrobacterales bacterium]